MYERDFSLSDLDAVADLAHEIIPLVRDYRLVALYGDLGVGKTEFVRALLRHMGIKCDVPSPTFSLVQHYEATDCSIAHYDLYRIRSADELDELGWDDALADGLVLVEWPEKAEGRLPQRRLDLFFTITNGQRHCHVVTSV